MLGKRPVYLNLLEIHLPVGGVVSILHRIAGVLLIALLPIGIYALQQSLKSKTAFDSLKAWTQTGSGKIFLLLLILIYAHHFFAGLRHLLQDIHIGLDRSAARSSAWLVFGMSLVVIILFAWCLL